MTRTPKDHNSRAKTLWLTILGLGLFWGGAALGVVMILAGCAGAPPPEPKIVIQKVTLPGELRPCIPVDFPSARPVYPDTDDVLRTLAGPPDRYQFVIAGRAVRDGWIAQLEAAVGECRKVPPVTP